MILCKTCIEIGYCGRFSAPKLSNYCIHSAKQQQRIIQSRKQCIKSGRAACFNKEMSVFHGQGENIKIWFAD